MKAERIPPIFHELREEFKVNQYDIVGHSIGGKIALLTAALCDDENLIRKVLALDPVDQVSRVLTILCELCNPKLFLTLAACFLHRVLLSLLTKVP
jgi:pimeloyl-ACP methyl ester carboxylesterase